MATPRAPLSPITVAEIKQSELYGVLVKAKGEDEELHDSVIAQKLIAAEDYYAADLGLQWQPTRVFSDPWGRQNGAFPSTSALMTSIADYDSLSDIAEPAYDYRADFWTRGKWGEMKLNHRPVRDIARVVFTYPGTSPIFTVPKSWIRLDQQFGLMQIVPANGEAIIAVLSGFIVNIAVGSYGSLPQSIYIDYTAGFTSDELCARYNYLLEGLRLRTLLLLAGIVVAVAQPGGATSQSLGLDGLSRSANLGGKFGAYSAKWEMAQAQEEDVRDMWKRRMRGIVMAVA